MDLMIDTNVVLDLMFEDRRDHEAAARFFAKMQQDGALAYVSASAATDIFYIIRKKTHDTAETYRVVADIFAQIGIVSVTDEDISEAFALRWRDFEDAVLMTVAKNNALDCVITNNRADFERAYVPVMTPIEYLTDSNR